MKFRRAARLLFEQQSRDLPYDMQQWIVGTPGLLIREEDVALAFPDVTTETLQSVLQQMVKASMLFPVGTGTYYKNIRSIEARGLTQV